MFALWYLTLLSLAQVTLAVLTLEAINDITRTTEEQTAKMKLSSRVSDIRDQHFMNSYASTKADLETVIAKAIRTVDNCLLQTLETVSDHKPIIAYQPPASHCPIVLSNFHNLLLATTHFLRQIQLAQEESLLPWTLQSPVYKPLSDYQALWASRRANDQQRSFIEQQLDLYRPTGCFKRIDEQVLRRDVEIVEWVNGLLERFVPVDEII